VFKVPTPQLYYFDGLTCPGKARHSKRLDRWNITKWVLMLMRMACHQLARIKMTLLLLILFLLLTAPSVLRLLLPVLYQGWGFFKRNPASRVVYESSSIFGLNPGLIYQAPSWGSCKSFRTFANRLTCAGRLPLFLATPPVFVRVSSHLAYLYVPANRSTQGDC